MSAVEGVSAAGGTAFTPQTGVATEYRLPGVPAADNQMMSFRVGATVTAPLAQAKGMYSGTLALTAKYLDI